MLIIFCLVTKFLDLNPVSALLSRKHLDSSLDSTLKQTTLFPGIGEEEKDGPTDEQHVQTLPVGLGPKGELTLKLQQALNQHGVVLQLPERIQFVEVRIHSKSIFIQWEVPEQNLEVTFDRTRSYSLHCFADVPLKSKKDRLQTLNRRILSINSSSPGLASHADSGYQEGASDTASQNSDGKLPLIPPSLRTSSSHNVSLVIASPPLASTLEESDSKPDTPNLSLAQKTLKPQSIKLAQSTAAARASGALLKLPALLTKTNEDVPNTVEQQEEMDTLNFNNKTTHLGPLNKEKGLHLLSPPQTFIDNQTSSQTSSSSSSNTTLTDSHAESHSTANNNMGTNIGLCHRGYAFEEIYSGQASNFTYSGIIPGATYYFRIRCCNAIGEGPWSDTYKCKIPTTSDMK